MPPSNHQLAWLIVLMIVGCSEWDLERVGFTRVITIGTIEVGSNSAFLIGDLENVRMASVLESGFIVSSEQKDDAGLRLGAPGVFAFQSQELDTISQDRAFATRATGLNGSTEYFFRAYALINGEEQIAYGNIDHFTTAELKVSLESVRRISEGCPTTAIAGVQVEGLAPGGMSSIGIVYSNDINNLAPTVDNGLLVIGENPSPTGLFEIPIPVACEESYFLRVVVNPGEKPIYSDDYAFTLAEGGIWEEREVFLGRLRSGKPVSFNTGDLGFMGGGERLSSGSLSDSWEYSSVLDEWDFLGTNENINLTRSVSLQHDGKIYILSGEASIQHCGKTGEIIGVHENLPIGVTYEQVCSNCPGPNCARCGTEIVPDPSRVDVFLDVGWWDCLCPFKGTIDFDMNDRSYGFQNSTVVGERVDVLALEIGQESFVVGGQSQGNEYKTTSLQQCDHFLRPCISSVLLFHPESPVEMDPFPGIARFRMIGFTVGGKGYAGFGIECTQSLLEGENGGLVTRPVHSREEWPTLNDFFSFDPDGISGNQWEEVAPFPISPLDNEAIIGFSHSQHGYLVIKVDDQNRILWQFDPDDGERGNWREIGAIPNIQEKDPYHLFTIGNKSYLYYPATNHNFWMYVPELE